MFVGCSYQGVLFVIFVVILVFDHEKLILIVLVFFNLKRHVAPKQRHFSI